MTSPPFEPFETLRAWLCALRPLSDPEHTLGRRAREQLPEATGLSKENVDYALRHCLEVDATDAALERLCSSTPRSAAAHILLSANVFTAPLRAIAIAIASAPRRYVRPSRRDPLLTHLLDAAAPGTFEIVDRLEPKPNEHVWAYGSDETMRSLLDTWPSGIHLHAHGHGVGVVAVTPDSPLETADYDAIALDVALFEQRGCLSPRIVVVEGDAEQCRSVATQLFSALERIAARLPVGVLSEQERIERARHRDLWQYLGTCYESRANLVSLDVDDGPWTETPGCRVLHVRQTPELLSELRHHEAEITSLGGPNQSLATLSEWLPQARVTRYGWMQRPPLDGPVDRRSPPKGYTLNRYNERP